MPPKRKAAEASEGSSRTTRSSARLSNTESKPVEKAAPKSKASTTKSKATKSSTKTKDHEEVEDVEPPVKKARTTKAKAAPKAAKGKKGAVNETGQSAKSLPATEAAPASKPQSSNQTYTAARALALFETYADKDDPSVIGPEGMEQLCADAQIPMEGALPMILAWQLDAQEMGKFTKDEWVNGMSKLKISSLTPLLAALSDFDNLLILDKPPAKPAAKKDTYDQTSYLAYAKDTKAAFTKFYIFCFNLAKPEQSRNIDMETSAALWSVVLAPKFPVMQEILDFINEKEGAYKATNKDLWSMMLEFCETVKPDLQDYESEGAWPTLLDDFVAWKKAKST